MTITGNRALPWVAAMVGALVLHGVTLWGLQSALARRAAAVTPVSVIQMVVKAAPARQAVAVVPSQSRAGLGLAASPVQPVRSNTVPKLVTAMIPSHFRSLPGSPSLLAAQLAQAVASVPESVEPVAKEAALAVPAQSNAVAVIGNGQTVGSVPAGAKFTVSAGGLAGQAQDVIVPPSADAAYLSNPLPDYPPMSHLRRESGTVMVLVLIGVDGRAQAARIETSSGYTRLDDAALITAHYRWRYRPATRNGVPEAMWYRVPLTFNLE